MNGRKRLRCWEGERTPPSPWPFFLPLPVVGAPSFPGNQLSFPAFSVQPKLVESKTRQDDNRWVCSLLSQLSHLRRTECSLPFCTVHLDYTESGRGWNFGVFPFRRCYPRRTHDLPVCDLKSAGTNLEAEHRPAFSGNVQSYHYSILDASTTANCSPVLWTANWSTSALEDDQHHPSVYCSARVKVTHISHFAPDISHFVWEIRRNFGPKIFQFCAQKISQQLTRHNMSTKMINYGEISLFRRSKTYLVWFLSLCEASVGKIRDIWANEWPIYWAPVANSTIFGPTYRLVCPLKLRIMKEKHTKYFFIASTQSYLSTIYIFLSTNNHFFWSQVSLWLVIEWCFEHQPQIRQF